MIERKKIAIFIDGSNLSAAIKSAGYRLDYDKVLKHYGAIGDVVAARYFTALPPKAEHTNLRRLTDRLSYNGWNIVTKETKELLSNEGIFKKKGNMDVEIAVQAMQLSDRITHLVLFSGDGDFVSLVQALQHKTIFVIAVSHFSRGQDCQIADELRRTVNEFIDLKTISHRWSMEVPDQSV